MQNATTSQKPIKKRSKIVGWIPFFAIIPLGFGIFFLVKSLLSDSSPQMANIVVKKNGKSYIYSNMGKFIVENAIKNKRSPAVIATTLIYKDEDEIFLDPMNLSNFSSLLSGNCKYYDYKDISVDGYVTQDSMSTNNLKTWIRSTKQIGIQLIENLLVLENGKKKFPIIWSVNSSTGEKTAVKNCEKHAFYVKSNPYPGKTVFSSKDFIVVNLSKIDRYFNLKTNYNSDEKILYIEQ